MLALHLQQGTKTTYDSYEPSHNPCNQHNVFPHEPISGAVEDFLGSYSTCCKDNTSAYCPDQGLRPQVGGSAERDITSPGPSLEGMH